jgi:hypothetical protein
MENATPWTKWASERWNLVGAIMTQTDKQSLIDLYESAVTPLLTFIRKLSPAIIDFCPPVPGAWTIRDHAIHFLDADTFAYGRIRLCVTQPGAEVFAWNEQAWQERGQYKAADPFVALEACQALRKIVGQMARAIVDEDWEKFHIHHPQRGRMTINDVLKLYADHAPFHLSYFERNVTAAVRAGL